MSDTRKIEKKFNDELNPLFSDLFNQLSHFVEYDVYDLQDKRQISIIIDDWVISSRHAVTIATSISIDECADLALQEANIHIAYLNTRHLDTLDVVTKEQINNLVDYVDKEFQQLIDYIILFSYTPTMVIEYLASLKNSLQNKIELTTTNCTLKNYISILSQVAQAKGYDGYYWQTMEDDRVRPTHQANDGKFFKWDNPPITGHPGTEINCRCIAVFEKE